MNKHIFTKCAVTNVIDEGNNIRTLTLDHDVDGKPGNFIMVWMPGLSEKPFALAYDSPIGITVKALGNYTQRLCNLKKGDKLWLRGPYGNSFIDFAEKGQKYLVAGGTGAAPIAMLAERVKDAVVILGGREKSDLVFEERFTKCSAFYVSTNDGSKGVHGMVTDVLDTIEVKKDSQFFVCGPEKMMRAVAEKAANFTNPENIFCSLEKHMKCSRGICGQCDVGGYRVCTDGPVFNYRQLIECKDFGKTKRDVTGKVIPINH